jgi:hypothetical protein
VWSLMYSHDSEYVDGSLLGCTAFCTCSCGATFGGGELVPYSADIGKYRMNTVKIKEFGISFRILFLHRKLFYI